MFEKIAIFTLVMAMLPGVGHAATCSTINLNRCLDSVCAINVSTNPAARCQYCGTSSAGTPPTNNMRTISVGQSSKMTISDKELKDAPTEPGARYVWAKTECFKKIANCTDEDTAKYDEMIQQSCNTAGVVAQKESLTRKAGMQKATKSSCSDDIMICMVDDARCGSDWSACASDADFDTFFASCGVLSTGCDEFMGDIRTQLSTSRKSAINDAADRIKKIAESYQTKRKSQLAAAQRSCTDNASLNQCIKDVCDNVMPQKCASTDDKRRKTETAAANNLCKFYELACDTVKNIQQ